MSAADRPCLPLNGCSLGGTTGAFLVRPSGRSRADTHTGTRPRGADHRVTCRRQVDGRLAHPDAGAPAEHSHRVRRSAPVRIPRAGRRTDQPRTPGRRSVAHCWNVFRARGNELLILNGNIDDPGQAAMYAHHLHGTPMTTIRLTASPPELAARAHARVRGVMFCPFELSHRLSESADNRSIHGSLWPGGGSGASGHRSPYSVRFRERRPVLRARSSHLHARNPPSAAASSSGASSAMW